VVVSKSLKEGSEVVPIHAVKACEASSTLVPRCVGLKGRDGQDYQGVRINRQNLCVMAYVFTVWNRVLL